jgi:acetyl-CoA synthetase
MLTPGRTYEETRSAFRWRIPARYNIGVDVCDRHAAARPDSVALIFESEDGAVERLSFGELRARTNRFANALLAQGLKRGDRLGVLLQ